MPVIHLFLLFDSDEVRFRSMNMNPDFIEIQFKMNQFSADSTLKKI
jgi:hypothetical protein